MRRYLIGGLTLVISIGVAANVLAASVDQAIDGKITPTKLPKKAYKNATLSVTTTGADADDPNAIPAPTNRAKIDFPKNMRIKQDSAPRCEESLEGTDRAAALALCGDSKVSKDGGSSATVALPLGPGGSRTDLPAEVMVFNGEGKTLLLWTRVTAVSTTTILEGTIRNASGKPYGKQLDVTVPPIAGGLGALTEFNAKVNKKSFIQAHCASKTMKFRGEFRYDGAPKEVVTDSHKCKRA
jgi:hypothetical protein